LLFKLKLRLADIRLIIILKSNSLEKPKLYFYSYLFVPPKFWLKINSDNYKTFNKNYV